MAAGPERTVLHPWTHVRRAVDPSEADAYYNGCTRQVPLALREIWRRGDGLEVTLVGGFLGQTAASRDCPRAALQETVAETRDRSERATSCDPLTRRITYIEKQVIETRQVQVMGDGQRRPGPWQRLTTIDAQPADTIATDTPCPSSVSRATAALGS
jgi:hypothetical protein